MDALHELLAPLAAYPRWLVIACLGLVGLAGLWLLAKLLKWTLYLVLLGLLLVVVLVACGWFLG